MLNTGISETYYSIEQIAEIVGGQLILNDAGDNRISDLLTDSRKIVHPENSLFFAIVGERHDGHKFIQELVVQGVRNFIVSEYRENYNVLKANFIVVNEALAAMQKLAAFHRQRFHIPVVGITGSNGKTIVKEWLYQLLRSDKNIVRSPKSFNSQVGVPLSLWLMNDEHQLALIEAGISRPGEMEKLQNMIKPTIGIFTNIGSAHDENFLGSQQKVEEKLKLFLGVDTLIYCKDFSLIHDTIQRTLFDQEKLRFFTWSKKSKADLQIGRITKSTDESEIQGVYNNQFHTIRIPFTDDASVDNAIHCWALMINLGYDQDVIRERMHFLNPVAMRLEMKNGINNTSVINDSYNSDIGSLTIALDFLNQQKQHNVRTIILSDILQSGRNEENLYREVAQLLSAKGVDKMIGIGEAIVRQQQMFKLPAKFFASTDDFLRESSISDFRDETILLKGARPFGFEKIGKMLQQKAHETVMEINLNALVHNLNYYRSRIKPTTKLMAMVKAMSYGSGSFEIANILQFHHVDYLAVAYTDEGVELREAGITLPIMVMNPEVQSFEAMIRYRLEPEMYNFRLLNQLNEVLRKHDGDPFRIHIKLDTGMRRLGFEESEINELVVRLRNNKNIRVESVFSHLAASDEAEHDGFTQLQLDRFVKMSKAIQQEFEYPITRHILNSSGILRFSEAQMDMVRLGIGLYGFAATNNEQQQLQHVATLKTTISQIKSVPSNETIGYSRKGKLTRDSLIATVAIGYADGINRRLGNGVGSMLVNGKKAPIIGNVCMDMCMLDITDIPAKEGDEVIVFGADPTVTEIANALGTIPYEILAGVSQRVKRIYYQE
ncbi:MAG TPA: bifunctional UDP-N-acetylmuramoyl-tripeptide:D-alanyl-D-alanine ligase/alanine racemase [Bacteroidia bacterium]|nr:bifunctional UDP-N-acetylmuramoyl-tripeptide:D-alanyl-D-alanine ligase/alanine racemase [Bacteroidia bacterium]HNP97904.1 bifunctional UDP-N-acetylmuramoyl-tripeptide:D-alanyl-D-alanine ligase/alanine racemase [Bacteroidia bacterium]